MSSPRPLTARARLVAVLTQEILQNPESGSYAIASEHQLCRQYNISRVTVRLALSDLENRGLIFRKHGKGTFAHGRGSRSYRNIGLLTKTAHDGEHRPVSELCRGIQTILAPLRSGLLVITTPPEEWRPEMASTLGGVVVLPEEITASDLQVIRDRNIPYFILGESDLPGPYILMGEREAARKMTTDLLELGHRQIAILSGYDLMMDERKRLGVYDALQAAGIDPKSVPEFSAKGKQSEIYRAANDVLNANPRPTGVVAFDDSLGVILGFHARKDFGLKVPDDLSIVSFHEWPFINFVEPALTTVQFDFFNAGQRAAEALNQAALTGQPLESLSFTPTYRVGQSLAAVAG